MSPDSNPLPCALVLQPYCFFLLNFKLFQKMKILHTLSFLLASESRTQKVVLFFPSCLAVSEPRSLSKSQTGFSDSKPRREVMVKKPNREKKKLAHTAEPQHWDFIWFWASWSGRFEVDIWKRWLGCQNEANTWFIVARICAQELNIWFYPPHTHTSHFLIYSSQANLIAFVFNGAVYCHLRRQAFKIIRAFKIVLGIEKNLKIRIPMFLPNLPTQHAAGWETS